MKGIFLKQTSGKSIASDNLQLHHVQISVIKKNNPPTPNQSCSTRVQNTAYCRKKKGKKKERKNRKNETRTAHRRDST